MRALILADLEGVSGIDAKTPPEGYCSAYTYEAATCVSELKACGVKEVTVCDIHNEGNLICPETISRIGTVVFRANLVSMVSSLTDVERFDIAMLIGFHGMAGSPGVLPHTLREDFRQMINVKPGGQEIPIGEVELYCKWLGSFGVPVVLVAGDREAAYEANCFNPYRQACCVKSLTQDDGYYREVAALKLASNVRLSLGLDFTKCMSRDSNELAVTFRHHDVGRYLSSMGFATRNEQAIFRSSADFVSRLYELIGCLNRINKEIYKANIEFVNEMRRLAKHVSKEAMTTSEAGRLLTSNLMDLDYKSRAEVLKTMRRLAGLLVM